MNFNVTTDPTEIDPESCCLIEAVSYRRVAFLFHLTRDEAKNLISGLEEYFGF